MLHHILSLPFTLFLGHSEQGPRIDPNGSTFTLSCGEQGPKIDPNG